MSWECHRCHKVHSDLTPSCNCPPPAMVVTSTAGDWSETPLAQMMVDAAKVIANKPDTLTVAKAWLAYVREHFVESPGAQGRGCVSVVAAIVAGRMP